MMYKLLKWFFGQWDRILLVIIFPIYGKLYKWYMIPQLIYGEYDYPSLNSTTYYIKVDSYNKNYEANIKLILKPLVGLPFDYDVKITHFFASQRFDHCQEIKLKKNDTEHHKIVEFKLPANYRFRLVVTADVWRSGIFFHHNYTMNIDAPDIIVKKRPHVCRFSN